MTSRHTTPLTPRGFVARLSAAAGVMLLLLLLSPGIGTESASFGWWDAWRARLGRAGRGKARPGGARPGEARSFTNKEAQ